MRKTPHTRLLLLLLAICGCTTSAATGPPDEVSCSGNSGGYFFSVSGAWLWTTFGSIYSITDPSNPVSHFQQGYEDYGGDTAFTLDTNIYIENNGSLLINTIGLRTNPRYETLTASYPRHLAVAPGTLYFLRHTTYSGNESCWQGPDSVNELEVDQFNDTSQAAILLARVPLTDPNDIAISGNTLFVLDGTAGLKVFDVSNPTHPALSATLSNVQGYHLQVTDQSTLLVSSSNGLTQYDVSNASSPVLLSKIQ